MLRSAFNRLFLSYIKISDFARWKAYRNGTHLVGVVYPCAVALCNYVARTLDRSIVALIHLCKHIHSLLRSLLSLRVLFNLQPLKQSMTDIGSSIFFAKCAFYAWLCQAYFNPPSHTASMLRSAFNRLFSSYIKISDFAWWKAYRNGTHLVGVVYPCAVALE